MTAYICQISETDWLVSREIGVYGNREGSEREGKVRLFTKTKGGEGIIQSIIEDLIGMKKGDIVFFHVLKKGKESTINGVYRCKEEPYYNESEIWESAPRPLVYPYRFCFTPHPNHVQLCRYDANIPVSEFYRAVENRAVRSILTLEREVRGAAHAVKTITRGDAEEIIKLLYRRFHVHHAETPVGFEPIQMQMRPLRDYIRRIGKVEFAIKALVSFDLGNKNSDLTRYIPACKDSDYDFLVETFVGQTMRKPLDLLCIATKLPQVVTIIEAKTDQAQMQDLIQVLKYQEIFKLRNIDKGSLDYRYSFCLLAKRFDRQLVEYSTIRNAVLPHEEIILLKYKPTQDGKNATFATEALQEKSFASSFRTYRKINTTDTLNRIASHVEEYYKVLQKEKSLLEITLKVSSKSENKIILEKKYKHDDKEFSVGQILIYTVPGECLLRDIKEFMNVVYEEANKNQGDFMNTEPIIVAQAYETLVGIFIEKYNKHETSAQRQPISAYIL